MLKGLGLVAAAALAAAGAAHAASPAEAQVRGAFESYDQGWRAFDVAKVTDAFADDFEWTNEVGVRITDKADFRGFLTHIFGEADFRAGQNGPLVIRSIRFPAPGVAVISSSEETDGQVDSATHKVVKVLHANELTVMRRIGGRWLIVSDLTADEAHGI